MADPTITPRALAALKPFMDEALRLRKAGLLVSGNFVSSTFQISEWRELLAAFEQSMVVDEGASGGELPHG